MEKTTVGKNWIQKDLRRLRNNTLVLVVITFSTLGVLLGYYLFSDTFRGSFNNVSYAYEGSEMKVEWETKFPARTRIEHGTSQIYLNETDFTESFETTHATEVIGLLPGKPHFFRLIAEDNTGEKYISDFYTAQ